MLSPDPVREPMQVRNPSAFLAVAGSCAGLLLSIPACSEPGPVSDRTNVVLIIIDTLRADMLSSYGHPADPSPALTRMAKDGVQFDSVLSQTSWTLPSVGSMLTSRYPRTLGLYIEGGGLVPDQFETLAEVLQADGYRTFGITANPNLNSRSNFDQGFDEYVDSVVVFKEAHGELPEGKVFAEDATLHSANEVFGKTLEFVRDVGHERPYFLQIDLMEVHEHRFRAMLRDEFAELFAEQESPAYLRKVRQVTDDIESFVAGLRELDEGWRDTLFVITSDHGEGLMDHPGVNPSRGHGTLLYDSHVHVPWIMFNESWKPAHKRIAQDVRLLELVPTVLDYLHVAAPAGIEGVSLLPLIEGAGGSVDLPEAFVSETYFRGKRKISVRDGEWQYIHNRVLSEGLAEHELQARGAKPNGVLTDQSGEHAGDVERLRAFVAEWEAMHKEAPATVHLDELTDAEREQLSAVGYLE